MSACLGGLADMKRHVHSIQSMLQLLHSAETPDWVADIPESWKRTIQDHTKQIAEAARFLQSQTKATTLSLDYFQERAKNQLAVVSPLRDVGPGWKQLC
jgi:hypothetical protein